MKRLTDITSTVTKQGGRWVGTISDPRTRQTLCITADCPFAAYPLDDDQSWQATGKRPDGVIVAENGSGSVIFVELKGALDPDDPDRAFDQIQSALDHFGIAGASGHFHAREHHTQWKAADDLPTAPVTTRRQTALRISPLHRSAGAIIVSRAGTRHKPRFLSVGTLRVLVVVIPAHGRRGISNMALSDLCSNFD